MHNDSDWREQNTKNRRRWVRSAASFLLIAFVVGVALLVFEFPQDAGVGEDPALEALLEVRSHLAQSYGPEQDVLSQSQAAHRELRAAIDLLAAVERADPAATEKIEELRTNLEAIEFGKDFEEMTSKELQARYQKLRTELQVLIDAHLELRH